MQKAHFLGKEWAFVVVLKTIKREEKGSDEPSPYVLRRNQDGLTWVRVNEMVKPLESFSCGAVVSLS